MYATTYDIRSVVARDQLVRGSAADLSEAQLSDALRNAQAEVDGRLRGRYIVPFPDPVPALVRSVTVDIAAYLTALVYYQETELLAGDPPTLRYLRAIALLKDIALGDIELDTGDGGLPGPDAGDDVGTPINPYEGSMFGFGDFDLSYGYGYGRGWGW